MALRLLIVGRAGRDPLISAAEEYLDRARRHVRIDVVELDAGKRNRGADDARIRAAEAEAIRKQLRGARLVALDASGRSLASEAFAAKLEGWLGQGDLAFAIGGATGLDPALLREAAFTLSLGAMTLPHRLARLVLSEQIYRALAILHGEPYHK